MVLFSPAIIWRCKLAKRAKADIFERTPEFLAAFKNIQEHGFFERLEVGVNTYEGRLHLSCRVSCTGRIPNSPKYAAEGAKAFLDPAALLAKVREAVKGVRVKHCSVEVKTEDWPLYRGDNIVGSKGVKTDLLLFITFSPTAD